MPIETSKPVQNQFIERLYKLIADKLDDSSFGVSQLAAELNMSRASLHRKVKAISGFSASKLINRHRMENAGQLLLQGYSSSQVAYKTGFDSPAYFSKCFREYFGKTPVEFIKNEAVIYS